VAEEQVEATLAKLFDAEREARQLHDGLVSMGREAVLGAVTDAIAAASAQESSEATIQLVCLARLLGEFDGADVTDALIDVLNSDELEARSEAGEQLQGLAYDRFKEVALGVERALERFGEDSNALVELPYILVEIPEGGVVKLLTKFLSHTDADVVGSAIEALVEVGDGAAVGALKALTNDDRVSSLGEADIETEVRIGDLAQEALEMLGTASEDDGG
jgi:HEAT repeat protein